MALFDPAEPQVRLVPRQPPPAHYYANNLLVLVRTVLDRYADLLHPRERDFGERLLALSPDGQRLLARLVGRSGPLIREHSVCYAEVGDLASALAELADSGFIERCPEAPVEALLDLLTQHELARAFRQELASRAPRPTRKADRIACIRARCPHPYIHWRLRRAAPWLALAAQDCRDLYSLLFFGDTHRDLTTFVMRDLGLHRYEPVAPDPAGRLFADRRMLARFLELEALRQRIGELGASVREALRSGAEAQDAVDSASLAELMQALAVRTEDRILERRRARALNALGRHLERAGRGVEALACFERSTLAPARERRMRILQRFGRSGDVEAVRADILKRPESTLEADFARRFARPPRRPRLPVFDNPAPAETGGIEQYALGCLTAAGGDGWHLENHLPMALFALAYWEWLFAPVRGAFVNAFQTGPLDLFWPDFFDTRHGLCADPLQAPLKPRLLATARRKAGTANRLFSWLRCTEPVLRQVLEAVPERDLQSLVGIVREDLAGRRSGFPDLTVVYGPGRYEFVEVKGPGDQLQIHQRLWIEALADRGLPVRVMRFRPP